MKRLSWLLAGAFALAAIAPATDAAARDARAGSTAGALATARQLAAPARDITVATTHVSELTTAEQADVRGAWPWKKILKIIVKIVKWIITTLISIGTDVMNQETLLSNDSPFARTDYYDETRETNEYYNGEDGSLVSASSSSTGAVYQYTETGAGGM